MDGHFSECVLCQIANREVRAKVLYHDDLVLCLDIPKEPPVRIAPVHFLVVPKEHLPSAREAETRHEPALGRLITVAARVAREMGVEATGYRSPATQVAMPARRSSTCTFTASAGG